MNTLPDSCVVDTNVPKTANRASDPLAIPDELVMCVLACIEAIQHVINQRALVLDDGDEIFNEYRHQLSLRGQPGVGDVFMKWVHDNRWTLPEVNRVAITQNGESYNEFPDHPELGNFDRSDRKFAAVANAHPAKPPILQATDSKWWGWKEALAEVGVEVRFLCPDYAKAKHGEKMGV
jgi:hypothetical protein